mgnify:CR=1 FL=1
MLCFALGFDVRMHGTNSIHVMRNATPEEVDEWNNTDFFMKGDFDVMKLFVVVPAVIQIMCLGMMFAVMFLNSQLF